MIQSSSRWARREPWRRICIIALAATAAGTWSSSAQQEALQKSGDSPVISFSSAAGAVEFQHEMHFSDFGIDCVECHHEANARALETPHAEYLKSSSIDCSGCHREGAEAVQPHACSRCHPDTPADIADETLSSKVVIHEVCWSCHEAGLGEAASRSCSDCHQRGPESH
jgi:hypothetical protein